jgi:hypothetical protein
MASIRFNLDKTGRLKPPVLTSAQLKDIGEQMVKGQKARWARGVNAEGRPARKLHKVTAKGKVTYGAKPLRNMVMTGLTKSNFTLRKYTMEQIRAENTSREARRHARQAQLFERMIGISPKEEATIFLHAYRAYGAYLRTSWEPKT